MQGSSQGGQTRNEGAEVCYHAKEILKFCDVSWCGQGSGWTPDSSLRHPNNFTSGALTCVFLGLALTHTSGQLP